MQIRASHVHITEHDIAKLQAESSVEARSELSGKIALRYSACEFSQKENLIAEEIFRILVKDAERMVRESLAENLQYAHQLPNDIAKTLATDEKEVAVHMVRSSYALTEEDLIEIVGSTKEVMLLGAIARRESISSDLAAALLDADDTEVMQLLFSNRGASVRSEDIETKLDIMHDNETLLELLVKRGGLSVALAYKLFELVGNELKSELTKKYKLSHTMADEHVRDASIFASLNLRPEHAEKMQLETLVSLLHRNGELSFATVLRALCQGDVPFFEIAMAKMVGIPVNNAKMLILDPGGLGFETLYKASPFPDIFYSAVKELLTIALDETSYGRFTRSDYQKRVVERVMQNGHDKEIEHMDYLLNVIKQGQQHARTLH